MLVRNQLSQKRQRVRWIYLAFFLVLASIGEAFTSIGLGASAANLDKGSRLQKMPHQPLDGVRSKPVGDEWDKGDDLDNSCSQTEAAAHCPRSQAEPGNEILEAQPRGSQRQKALGCVKTASISQKQAIATIGFARLLQDALNDTIEQHPLPAVSELERNPSLVADKLFDSSENGELLYSDRTKQPQQSESNSQAKQAENGSNTTGTNSDPDLGILRLREQEVPPPAPPPKPPPSAPPRQSQPILHLLPRISFFQTNNVLSSVDPVGDSLIYPSLMLWAVPQLGRNTYLTPSIEGSLIRYIKEPQFNYNLVRFRTGISQRLNRQMFGEIGWTNQQFYRAEQGDRFLNEHIAYLSLSRQDQLTRQLRLSSFYEFRVSFADPDYRSRVINSLYLSLSYSFQSNLQVGLDYQFERSDFTVRSRYDQYHRIMGRLTYGVLRDSQVNIVGGASVGGSSESFIDFDSLFFSVTYSVDFPIY